MMSIYKIGRQGAAHADGLAAVIEMALQSPQFLYRVEYGLPVVDKTVTQPTRTSWRRVFRTYCGARCPMPS